MKSSDQKKLRKKFFNILFFLFPFAMSLVALGNVKVGIIFPFVIEMAIYIVEIGILSWVYYNRISAKAFIIAEISQILTVILICGMSFYINPFMGGNLWMINALITSIIMTSMGYIKEIKNWEEKQVLWEKVKKLDIARGRFNILVIARNNSKDSNLLMLSGFVVPLIVGILVQIARHSQNFEQISGNVVILILVLLFSTMLGGDIAIYSRIAQIEKRSKIIFTTEYREAVR